MATIEKRAGNWRAKIRLKGNSESQTFATKAQAQAWVTRRESELRALGSGAAIPHSLRDALCRYSEEVTPTHKGERWEQVRLKKFQRDIPFVGEQLDRITPERWAHWRDSACKKISPASVRREISLLSSVYETARKEWRWSDAPNPFGLIRKPRPGKPRRRLFQPAEVTQLCKALGLGEDGTVETPGQRVALALLFALETGMRAGEICKLTAHDVDKQGRVAMLRDTKNGDDRKVPMTREAIMILERLPESASDDLPLFGLTSALLDTVFRKARDKCGIEDIHFHDSRATALTRLSRRVDVLTLSRISGHRDIKILANVYYRESAEDIAQRL